MPKIVGTFTETAAHCAVNGCALAVHNGRVVVFAHDGYLTVQAMPGHSYGTKTARPRFIIQALQTMGEYNLQWFVC